jgi:hypothetical protein
MSYSKKDEDADQAIMKVDRTSVFQEGQRTPLGPPSQLNQDSPTVQLFTYTAAKMPNPPHKDCPSTLHGREISYERGDHPVLWHFEVVPK